MTEPTILKVAVNVPLSRLFDYLPPTATDAAPPGSRVLVPFGRQKLVGLVMAHGHGSDLPANKIKRCEAVLDAAALLSDDDLQLIRFTSNYYHHPIGEVAAAALPTLLRAGKPLWPTLRFIAISDAGASVDMEATTKRAPRQAELMQVLSDAGGNGIEEDELTQLAPNWRRAAKGLFEKGWIERLESQAEPELPASELLPSSGPELNADQKLAVEILESQPGFGAYVLDGVTGSGED